MTVRPDRQGSLTVNPMVTRKNGYRQRLRDSPGGYHLGERRVCLSDPEGLAMKRTHFAIRAFVSVQTFIATGILFVAACGNDEMPPVSSNGTPLQPCANDGECSRPTPYCAAGYCVECLSNNN